MSSTRGIAKLVRTTVRRSAPGTFLRTADLADKLGSPRAVESALSRMAHADEPLVHVRHGLYWRSPKSRFGKAHPRPIAVALALRNEGIGPSGWTALRTLGLTTQMPAEDELAVIGSPPTGVGGIKFYSRNSLARRSLGYHEIATLEALRSVGPESPEWGALVRAVVAFEDEKRVRLGHLAKAATNEPPRVRRGIDALAAALAN